MTEALQHLACQSLSTMQASTLNSLSFCYSVINQFSLFAYPEGAAPCLVWGFQVGGKHKYSVFLNSLCVSMRSNKHASCISFLSKHSLSWRVNTTCRSVEKPETISRTMCHACACTCAVMRNTLSKTPQGTFLSPDSHSVNEVGPSAGTVSDSVVLMTTVHASDSFSLLTSAIIIKSRNGATVSELDNSICPL